MSETQTVPQGVVLTDVAVSKVRSLLEAEGRTDLSLRIAVQPGGCSGLRYQLYFDDRELDGDIATEYGDVKVVTDKMSAPYLGGASIDFVDTIEKQGFTIDNPNATGARSPARGDRAPLLKAGPRLHPDYGTVSEFHERAGTRIGC